LAFFALACQFVLTFGHVHLGTVRGTSAALAISAYAANGSADGQSLPAQRTPSGLDNDFCAVCKNISLASMLVLAASPAAIVPISFVRPPPWSLVTMGFASRDHINFSARAPPDSDLPA
jgi:hypothetical protein